MPPPLLRPLLRLLLSLALLFSAARAASAIEVKVSAQALERTLQAQLFNGPQGRYYIRGDANFAFPSAEIARLSYDFRTLGLGYAIDAWQPGSWGDLAGGAAGGLGGAFGAVQIVRGALRRGGTAAGKHGRRIPPAARGQPDRADGGHLDGENRRD